MLTKKQKAERLVELTDAGVARRKFDESALQSLIDVRRKFESDTRSVQAELREKHYTEQQLDALLEFYESEIGLSILESNKSIRKEFSERIQKISQDSAKQLDNHSNLAVRIESSRNENRDRDADT